MEMSDVKMVPTRIPVRTSTNVGSPRWSRWATRCNTNTAPRPNPKASSWVTMADFDNMIPRTAPKPAPACSQDIWGDQWISKHPLISRSRQGEGRSHQHGGQ